MFLFILLGFLKNNLLKNPLHRNLVRHPFDHIYVTESMSVEKLGYTPLNLQFKLLFLNYLIPVLIFLNELSPKARLLIFLQEKLPFFGWA